MLKLKLQFFGHLMRRDDSLEKTLILGGIGGRRRRGRQRRRWLDGVTDSTDVSLGELRATCLQTFPASESFPMSQLFAAGGPSIGVSASASVLPMNTQD